MRGHGFSQQLSSCFIFVALPCVLTAFIIKGPAITRPEQRSPSTESPWVVQMAPTSRYGGKIHRAGNSLLK